LLQNQTSTIAKTNRKKENQKKRIFFSVSRKKERKKDGAGYLFGSQLVVLICVYFIYSFFSLNSLVVAFIDLLVGI